jgi:thioredoxin-like negative regulator of GroEL
MLGAMSGNGKDGGARRPRVISRPSVPSGPLADLKALMYELYLAAGTPTLDEIAAAVAADDKLAGAPGRDTIARIIGDAGVPPSQADVTAVAIVLARAACWDPSDAAGRARDLWVAVRMAAVRVSAARARVSEADPRRLGVHAAISVPGVPDEIPPEYVPRDVDAAEFGVRAKVAAAAERGGFVLLVGGSSVGKSRCAFEAVRALLPDWQLAHPDDPAGVAALAADPPRRAVVWLDELQRYLDGEHGLTGGVVRTLLNAPNPVVIIGTLWPDLYAAYTAMPAPGGRDPHARERQVLDLADIVRIAPEFSQAERDRARAAAVRDKRLAVAFGTAGYGLTQTLAAAPQLVARWEDARTAAPYGWAVLTSALDVIRLGARAPLSADFLRAAASGYCTSTQQAEAPEDWFEQAMAYATGKLHGAVAALTPQGAGMSQVRGYAAADYLVQHAAPQRRRERLPASTWDAVLGHFRDPADTARLANSARDRLLYCYAIPLYQHAANAGDVATAMTLAELLRERGDPDGDMQVLRARADAARGWAAWELARLSREHGDSDRDEQVLRARADAGDAMCASELAELLRERGDLDGLRARARVGDGYAASKLAKLLYERGDLVGAEQVLRARADAGDAMCASELAELLYERGDLDGAERVLRARADADDGRAAFQLAELLRERGDLDGAEQVLRARADADDLRCASELVELLRERGDLDGLRARARAGDKRAYWGLAELLRERGDLDGAEQVLRARADADDGHAAFQLAELLRERGDLDGAEQVLRARADADDGRAEWGLAELLRERGDLDGAEQVLRAWVNTGDRHAAPELARLLADQGRGEEAERLRRFGLTPDGSIARP